MAIFVASVASLLMSASQPPSQVTAARQPHLLASHTLYTPCPCLQGLWVPPSRKTRCGWITSHCKAARRRRSAPQYSGQPPTDRCALHLSDQPDRLSAYNKLVKSEIKSGLFHSLHSMLHLTDPRTALHTFYNAFCTSCYSLALTQQDLQAGPGAHMVGWYRWQGVIPG